MKKIVNVVSPLALNSSELFLNLKFKGMVTHKFNDNLYLSNLDPSLINVEGSPILDRKDY